MFPSFLFALDDELLGQNILIQFASEYFPVGRLYDPLVDKSEYLSPQVNTKAETLAKFPRTRVISAGLCVFKDDNIKWVSNLLKPGAQDVKLQIYRLLPHGFLHVG